MESKTIVILISLTLIVSALNLGMLAFNAGNIISIQNAAQIIRSKCEATKQ